VWTLQLFVEPFGIPPYAIGDPQPSGGFSRRLRPASAAEVSSLANASLNVSFYSSSHPAPPG
ncbi:MAG: hypothetical protein ABI679_15275, partial [Gemmatimonadota bacterium]